jgi:hypothetical protein
MHPVKLTGLRASRLQRDAAPLIVKRTDQDFVAGLLADLADDEQRKRLHGATPPRLRHARGIEALRLLQPVQRVFHLALLEAWCDEPGQPRLERSKIESAGLVVRRFEPGGPSEPDRMLAWVKAGTRNFGWEAVNPDVDPALDQRALPFSVGNAFINRRLASNFAHRNAGAPRLKPQAKVTEQVYPLFVAPPEVCAAAGKTLLFATVPVTAQEQAEPVGDAAKDAGSFPSSPQFGKDPQERQELEQHLVHYLKAGGPKPLPRPGRTYSSEWARDAAQRPEADPRRIEYEQLETLRLLVQQLHVEFDAFGEAPPAIRLFGLLNRIEVEFDTFGPAQATGLLGLLSQLPVFDITVPGITITTRTPAGHWLKSLRDVLLDGVPGASFLMPHRWGAVGEAHAKAILDQVLRCLDEQYKKLRPARGRFDDEGALYVVRAFVRLKPQHPGCPAQLLWSQYSEPFTVAPWHEPGDAPPITVPLPDLFDREVLKKLKPNVAFVVPKKLARLLQADVKDLMAGKGSGEGFSIGWICGFSIPIITICAFIVLMIFLVILNLIFWWLPFLKVCIPIPRGKPPIP